MPSSNSVRAGQAFVELYVRDKVSAGLTRAAASLKAFSRVADRVGMQMMRTGALMAVPVAVAGKAFMGFEKQMAEVSTMLDEPSENIKALSGGILQASTVFGRGTEEMTRGLYNILSAVIPVEDSMDLLNISSKAAVAGLSDVGTSAKTITGFLNAYGYDVGEAARVSDVLFTTIKRGTITFSEMNQNLGKISGIAAAAGVSVEELGASLAVVTKNNIPADIAITGLRTAFAKMLKPAKESADLFEEIFGIEMNTSAIEKIGGVVPMMKKIASLPKAEDTLGKLFPDQRAIMAMLPMLHKIDMLEEDLSRMENSAGATQAAYDKMASTLSHVWDRMWQSGKRLMTVIGGILGDSFKSLGEEVQRIVTRFEMWIVRNKEIVKMFAKWAAILITTGAALKVVSFILGAFAPLLGLVSNLLNRLVLGPLFMLSKFLLVTSPLLLAFGAIMAGLNYALGWGLSIWEMFVGTLVAAVAAIAIYKAAVVVATIAQALWTAAVTTFKVACMLASNVWLLAAAGIVAGFAMVVFNVAKTNDIFEGFGESTKKTFNNIKDDAITSFGAITDAISMGDFEAAADMAILGLKAIWGSFWAWLKDGWRRIGDSITIAWNDIGDALIFSLRQMWVGMINGWSWVKEKTMNMLSVLGNWVEITFMTLTGVIQSLWHTVTGMGPSGEEIDARLEATQKKWTDARRARASEAEKERADNIAKFNKGTVDMGLFQTAKKLEKERKAAYEKDMADVAVTREEMKKLAEEIAKKKKEYDEKHQTDPGILAGTGDFDKPMNFDDTYVDGIMDRIGLGVSEGIEGADVPNIEIPQLDDLSSGMSDMGSGMNQAAEALALGQQGAFGAASNLRNIQGIFGKAAKWENQVIDKLDQMNGYMRSIDMTEKKQLRNLTW